MVEVLYLRYYLMDYKYPSLLPSANERDLNYLISRENPILYHFIILMVSE
jgi:hypothetical protein